MSKASRFARVAASVILVLFGGVCGSCYSEGPAAGSGHPSVSRKTTSNAGGQNFVDASVPSDDAQVPAAVDSGAQAGICALAQAESIPARVSVTSDQAVSSEKVVFTSDLFNKFKSYCGGCHVEQDQGKFQVLPATFATKADKTLIERMLSEDPDKFMPPPGDSGGMPASKRPEGDPILEFAALLQKWIDAGRPSDLFYLPAEATGASPYVFSKALGSNLTNIGNCIPDKAIVGREKEKGAALDAFFASAVSLPPRLQDTDLTTFDSETLARYRVVGFAPGYPLWADDAKKLRFVRVPFGETIRFNEQTQQFDIPPNTRFYKTFLKKVIDSDGNETFRKMETRLIVSRPDGPDGPTALFGTYQWNEEETEALLVVDPYRNGKPFADTLSTYITDEVKAKAELDKKPRNGDYALRAAGLSRHYAIPGAQRCIDCHMGSASQSFILGFMPLQIHRRPTGEGGVIEETGPDELNQLQRLIDYGIVSGLKDEKDVVPLESAELPRTHRTGEELLAQGYILGNCGHCHNPRGLPSVKNPELTDILDFLPNTHGGGIFEFDMQKTSPRIFRGPKQDTPIPYITPSLRDMPVDNERWASGGALWSPKEYIEKIPAPAWTLPGYDAIKNPVPGCCLEVHKKIEAPWRSLIYRNVDTPFTYTDDFAIFPHMPLHTPGYDCRTRKLLGDWMVSIPSRKLDPTTTENVDNFENPGSVTTSDGRPHTLIPELRPQPYAEVKKGDDGYDAAVADAQARLTSFHSGGRYDHCPDTSDIIDPSVDPNEVPPQFVPAFQSGIEADGDWGASSNIPGRPHWIVTDLTDNAGKWYPRRNDWDTVLVDKMVDGMDEQQKVVVDLLQSVTVTDAIRQFALKEIPFGTWVDKPECNLDAEPTVSSYAGSTQPRWFNLVAPPLPGSAHVYSESPGAAVFNNICINCHGAKADSKGRLADTLLTFTGGDTRVANLRDGLLGPVPPGPTAGNRHDVFGPRAKLTNLTDDDWAARYVAWMGLGGTKRAIPAGILSIVNNTLVLGRKRDTNKNSDGPTSANMLQTAQFLCAAVLGQSRSNVAFDVERGEMEPDQTALISQNGDEEMWERLCAVDNPLPVRMIRPVNQGQYSSDARQNFEIYISDQTWYPRDAYPSSAMVGKGGKVVEGLAADNVAPWCLFAPTDPDQLALAQKFAETNAVDGIPLPLCPSELTDATPLDQTARDRWTLRGAINAGLAVYLYLDALEKGAVTPQVPYDHCELAGR